MHTHKDTVCGLKLTFIKHEAAKLNDENKRKEKVKKFNWNFSPLAH